MLKFEGRNLHAPAGSLPKDVKQPVKGGLKSKNKQKLDSKRSVQQSQQKTNNQTTTKGKNNALITSGDRKYTNPSAKKRHAISRDTVVLTKSQLQEILSAAKLTSGKDGEDHNSVQDNCNETDNGINAIIPHQYEINRDEITQELSANEIESFDSNSSLHKDNNNNTKKTEENEGLKLHPDSDSPSPSSFSDYKMSLVEQKRLQWAKERAQMQGDLEWNPWGRPGAGAPLNKRNSVQWNSPKRPNTNPSQPMKANADSIRTVLPPLPLTAPSSKKPVPPALRSSIGFGQVGLTTDSSYMLAKEEEKRKWLEELDRQREEQRLRKLKEHDSYQNLQLENHRNVVENSSKSISTIVPKSSSPTHYSPTLPTVTESGTDTVSPMGMDETTVHKSYLRGANIPVDVETRVEMEMKRQKQKEQQLAIQAQLEEKYQRKLQEKERRRLEELKEEERIVKECELLAHQKYLEEQQLIEKQKSHNENKNSKRETQQPEKKVEKRQNISKNDDNPVNENKTEKVPDPQEPSTAQIVPHQQISLETSPYIENRLLTPTKYRDSDLCLYPPRDCGTQTDSSFPRKKDAATDVDNKLSKELAKKSETLNKKTTKADSKTQKKDDLKQNERPKWGTNQSDKIYRKQSEKDLNYCHRRHLQEMRQKRLEYEAAIQNDQPQIGRTRSSAKLQRHLLAREAYSSETRSSTRNSERYLHPSSVESPLIDETTGDNIVRKPRRQWASPSTDEIPNFYTQPHQLPARRNSRSQSSNSMSLATPDVQKNIKYSREIAPSAPQLRGMQNLSSWNSSSDLRSGSPTLRAVKSSTHSLENVRLLKGSEDFDNIPVDSTVTEHSEIRTSNSYTNIMNGTKSSVIQDHENSDILRDSLDFNYIPYLRSSVILDRQTTPESNSRNDPRSDKNRILQQLSAIRQGLIMKQQELNKLLNPNELSLTKIFD